MSARRWACTAWAYTGVRPYMDVHGGTPLHGRTRGYTEVHGRTRGYAPTYLYVTDMLRAMPSALGLSKTFFDIFAYWISSSPGGWHRSSRLEPRPNLGIFRSLSARSLISISTRGRKRPLTHTNRANTLGRQAYDKVATSIHLHN